VTYSRSAAKVRDTTAAWARYVLATAAAPERSIPGRKDAILFATAAEGPDPANLVVHPEPEFQGKTHSVSCKPSTKVGGLSFSDNVRRIRPWPWSKNVINHKIAIFRQTNRGNSNAHHDAPEFPDGQIVLLTGRASPAAAVRATLYTLAGTEHRRDCSPSRWRTCGPNRASCGGRQTLHRPCSEDRPTSS
jgi:hypothetical protein